MQFLKDIFLSSSSKSVSCLIKECRRQKKGEMRRERERERETRNLGKKSGSPFSSQDEHSSEFAWEWEVNEVYDGIFNKHNISQKRNLASEWEKEGGDEEAREILNLRRKRVLNRDSSLLIPSSVEETVFDTPKRLTHSFQSLIRLTWIFDDEASGRDAPFLFFVYLEWVNSRNSSVTCSSYREENANCLELTPSSLWWNHATNTVRKRSIFFFDLFDLRDVLSLKQRLSSSLPWLKIIWVQRNERVRVRVNILVSWFRFLLFFFLLFYTRGENEMRWEGFLFFLVSRRSASLSQVIPFLDTTHSSLPLTSSSSLFSETESLWIQRLSSSSVLPSFPAILSFVLIQGLCIVFLQKFIRKFFIFVSLPTSHVSLSSSSSCNFCLLSSQKRNFTLLSLERKPWSLIQFFHSFPLLLGNKMSF